MSAPLLEKPENKGTLVLPYWVVSAYVLRQSSCLLSAWQPRGYVKPHSVATHLDLCCVGLDDDLVGVCNLQDHQGAHSKHAAHGHRQMLLLAVSPTAAQQVCVLMIRRLAAVVMMGWYRRLHGHRQTDSLRTTRWPCPVLSAAVPLVV